MPDSTLYDTTTISQGSLALAHQWLIRQKVAGAWINITGDVNNLDPAPSPITVQREAYGTKGRTSQDITGYNFAPTFDVEVIRDPVTQQIVAAQSWLIDLMSAAVSEGGLNKREFQIITDALDPRMPAFEGSFSVAFARGTSGYADKAVLRFTLNNDGVVRRITSPVAGTGVATIETVQPTAQAAGVMVAVRGSGLGSYVSATVQAKPVTLARVVDDSTLVIQIPTGVTAGAAPVVVTNAKGASAAFAYTAA